MIYMVYKIVKMRSKKLVPSSNNFDQFEVEIIEWYEAKRKGKYFGFWHVVGNCFYKDGSTIPHIEYSIERMKDYIKKYHEVFGGLIGIVLLFDSK